MFFSLSLLKKKDTYGLVNLKDRYTFSKKYCEVRGDPEPSCDAFLVMILISNSECEYRGIKYSILILA